MICDFEINVNITETVLGNNSDESCNENNDKTGSSSTVIEDYNFRRVDERRDNGIVTDNEDDGTSKVSKIKSNDLNIYSSSENNKNNNNPRKEETKYENKNNTHKNLNINTEYYDDDAGNRTFVSYKDYDGHTLRTNNNIISLSAEKEISDKVNMGQAAPNCKKNSADGETVNVTRIRKSNEQKYTDMNQRENGGEENVQSSRVGKGCTENEETETYDDCVIVVDREESNRDVKKETDNINSQEDPANTSEESKDDKRCEVCVEVAIEHTKEKFTITVKPHENIECTSNEKGTTAENKEPHISDACAAEDVDSSDNKLDARKQQESIKKKYVAESHIKEGDAVDRSWDSTVLADIKTSSSNEQKITTDSKDTLGETTTRGCIDNRNNVRGTDSNNEIQEIPDLATNSENNNERQRKTEREAQEETTDEKNNDNTQTNNDIKDCKDDKQECTTQIAQKDTHNNDNVGERSDETDNDDDNTQADDNLCPDSGIVYYKSKSLLKNQETMNRREKVKVDESEPSWNEEAPFERRDVLVKKDKWVTDLYAVDSLLGRGKFGEVKKCRERRTGRQLAAKFIDVSGPQDRTDVLNEVEMMKHLQHPRLLQLYDAFENRDRFCLVLELHHHDHNLNNEGMSMHLVREILQKSHNLKVSGGELFERVINDDFILTEKACVMFMRQICDGVAFMHSENILHLDMKPENILCLTREGNRIKIIDFGLARKYNPKDDLRVLFGTPEFVAPEVVNFDPICPATDMWSVGVICYVLLSGLSPFMGETEAETLSNVTMARWDFNAEEFENISAEAKDFIAKLLVKDPRKRISSAQCLEHQWLRRSTKRESRLPERSLSKKRLRKFVYRRKWQKAINAMLALRRMGVSLC